VALVLHCCPGVHKMVYDVIKAGRGVSAALVLCGSWALSSGGSWLACTSAVEETLSCSDQ